MIGCGAGVTAGAVSIDPRREERNDRRDRAARAARRLGRTSASTTSTSSSNPKVHIQIDDGRHYVATLKGKFDALTSDPLDPWVKGAAMLYTREFFEDVKAHLNPGGVVTLFVQLYESNTEAVKSEIGTFLEAFPNGMVFGNTNNGVGYDLVLFGQVEPTKINLDVIDAKLKPPEYAQVAQSLREIGFNSVVDLFSTYAGNAKDLAPWLKDAPINRDRNLRLQYLAGLGLNLYQSGPIYSEMLVYRTPAAGSVRRIRRAQERRARGHSDDPAAVGGTMTHPVLSLHHVTATVDDAQSDLDFCLDGLSLRLVKKTVNFDNHHVFHFYYGDERGTPGTIWTTFPYKGKGVPVGKKGAGQITVTSSRCRAGPCRAGRSGCAIAVPPCVTSSHDSARTRLPFPIHQAWCSSSWAPIGTSGRRGCASPAASTCRQPFAASTASR